MVTAQLLVNRSGLLIYPLINKQHCYRHSPTLKPCPMSVSAPCPFSAISVVLLPCSQVSRHCPFRQIRLQMRGAMTTLKRSRVEERSVHHTSLWTLSQMTSRWVIREGILASFSALHRDPGTLNQRLRSSAPALKAPALLTEADFFFFLESHAAEKKARPPSCFLSLRQTKNKITSLVCPSGPSVQVTRLASLESSSLSSSLLFPKLPPLFEALPSSRLLLWREQERVRMWVWERKKGGEGGEEKGWANPLWRNLAAGQPGGAGAKLRVVSLLVISAAPAQTPLCKS